MMVRLLWSLLFGRSIGFYAEVELCELLRYIAGKNILRFVNSFL